jgi:hypothetical protein
VSQLKAPSALHSFETSGSINWAIQRHLPEDLNSQQNRCSDYKFCCVTPSNALKNLFSGSKLLVTTDNSQNTIINKQTWYMWVHLPLYRDDNNVVLSGHSEMEENDVT